MRLLFVGDVFGRPGRRALKHYLETTEVGFDLIVANGENAAGGMGITPAIAEELLAMGVHVITTGNHVWQKREIIEYIDTSHHLLRPMNYPDGTPGRGSVVVETTSGAKVLVVNLLGRVFMEPVDNPFRLMDDLLTNPCLRNASAVLVDFHAEATSEKIAMGWYLDGRVAAVIGTHTHVQTADERILPGGTAYITDVGMTGAHDSVIGVKKKPIIERFLTMMPTKFDPAKGDVIFCAVVVDIDTDSGKALSIARIRQPISENG